MENNLDILENIMKPYFDKKKEIESATIALENDKSETRLKIQEMKTERINKRKELEIELENLRVRRKVAIEDFKEKKEIEIDEYISESLNTDSNFFASYGSMLRKDLEQEYDKKLKELETDFDAKEESLINQITNLKMVSEEERTEKQSLENLNNKSDYNRVDLRELVEIKNSLRKQLFAEQKRLNKDLLELKPQQELYEQTALELKQRKQEFNEIMDKLSNFKYEYNDQNQVINSDEWRRLYEESNEISKGNQDLTQTLSEQISVIHQLNDINKSLEKIDEYLGLTELTKEEYNRRKDIQNNVNNENVIEPEEDLGVIDSSDVIEINDPVASKYEEKNGNVVVDKYSDLLKTIYNDVVEKANNLKSVKLNGSKEKLGENEYYISSKKDNGNYEVNGTVNLKQEDGIMLPCGEYVYDENINEAVDNLFNKTKGRSYIVKETRKEYNLSKTAIENFKSKIKKCSTIKLIKEKKIGKLDLLRVFGKRKADEIVKEIEIGEIKDNNLPEGDYINRNELIVAMDNLFTTKKLDWLKNLTDTLKDKKDDSSMELEKENVKQK
ncbi:MAG: hypothetical protein E7174_01010 [Firmicutes bacterium]|nr:hypothetical protein [Bacillota bacterium]